MSDAYVFDHVRTPRGRGKPDGALHEVTPIKLVATVLDALRERTDRDTARVDDVILGCVMPVGEQGANVARVGAMEAGYAATVMAGQSDLVIAGGVESMSRVPMGSDGGAWATDPQIAYDTYFVPQGISADLIATRHGFSRRDLDEYSAESQRRASEAWDRGYFDRSVVPVRDHMGDVLLDRDEHMRPGTSADDLGELRAAFEMHGQQFGFDSVAMQKYPDVEAINHVHTGGNSSGIVDGAAAVLIGSKEAGESLGLKPRARIRAFASIGSEPTIMLTGPGPASLKALSRAGMGKDDIDLFELNEAFAAVVLRYMQQLEIDHGQINVNGGAIAMGHPLGATGAMVFGTALDEMDRRGLGNALVTLCIGAGMGTATIIESV
jgi:acetyl-CoA C-acetyltransferase